jgi:magnesium-transporting ATPase (P-type)
MALRLHVMSTIKRNGQEKKVPSERLLVGDILTVNQGDELPADCIFISGTELVADESALTGETKPKYKAALASADSPADVTPFLKGGSFIREGSGIAVVCSVGANTESGKIQVLVSEQKRELTPLQRKLVRIGDGTHLAFYL